MRELDARDFLGLLMEAIGAENEQTKAGMIAASFTSWQIIETLKAMFIEKSKPATFGSYLEHFGLKEKTKTDYVTAESALSTAAAIVAAAKREAQKR